METDKDSIVRASARRVAGCVMDLIETTCASKPVGALTLAGLVRADIHSNKLAMSRAYEDQLVTVISIETERVLARWRSSPAVGSSL